MYNLLHAISQCQIIHCTHSVSDDFLPQNGNTALSLAKSEGHLGVVELLRRASIQPTKMVLY